jgi:hypothetical protein
MDGRQNDFNRAHFYLPHMEYEGSIGFVAVKMIFFAGFHVLGLFIAKKSDAQVGRVNAFIILHTMEGAFKIRNLYEKN